METSLSLGSNAIQKSRSYSNFDSLKRTDGDLFRNVNTLGQVRNFNIY